MIQLTHNRLEFTFPQVHADASMSIDFQRTLRIPDDGNLYPLPAGLGEFPLRHVDDATGEVPESWLIRGGVMLPMYQAEAMWVNFDSDYPVAVKIAAGKINAVTGEQWRPGLTHGPTPSDRPAGATSRQPVQDYVVVPTQPWLDGFNVGAGRIRQFVAMPLGAGYSAEEQLTGAAEYGGMQLLAYPMKAGAYQEWRASRRSVDVMCCEGMAMMAAPAPPDMGLGLGGLMRQEIYADPHDPDVWDLEAGARCFVHLANSRQWAEIAGEAPPTSPPTAAQYAAAGIPWFDFYSAGEVLPGSPELAALASVVTINSLRADTVRDGDWDGHEAGRPGDGAGAGTVDPLIDNSSIAIDRVHVVR